VPAHVRSVPGHDDHVAGAYRDRLVATWANVCLARLGGMDPPDVEAERLSGGGEVGDLLELFQLERCTLGLLAPPTASRRGAGHANKLATPAPARTEDSKT
jgi:hypothetical protein